MGSEKIQDLIANGYEFKTGEYIREGWDLFKKNAGGFILYLFIYMIVSGTISFIPYLGQVVNLFISYPLIVGFYIVADKTKHGETVEFGDFFKGFSKILPLFIAKLLVSLISFILPGIYLVVISHGMPNQQALMTLFTNDPAKAGILLLLCLPGIYFSICYILTPFFIFFKNYSPWDAMETSRKIVSKNWFSMFGFLFVLGLILLLGLICLILGLLVAVPVMYCALYAAFNDIVGTRDTAAETNISDHLITV